MIGINITELQANVQDAVSDAVHSNDCTCQITMTVRVSEGQVEKPRISILHN